MNSKEMVNELWTRWVLDLRQQMAEKQNTKADETKGKNSLINSTNIADYKYIEDEQNNIAKTIIRWKNGVVTTCTTSLDKADQYVGFMIAIAKYAMGNKNQATNLADYWINKVPTMKTKEERKRLATEAERRRIEEKRRKERTQNRIRKAAIRRAEEYAARKLAYEKYGVPEEFSCTLEEIDEKSIGEESI